MRTISRRERHRVMRIICDYYAEQNESWPLIVPDLYLHGFPHHLSADQTAYILESMGYIKLNRYYNAPSSIELTDKGRCYFEVRQDQLHEKLVEWIRYIITTVIAVAALITAIVSIALQYL